MLFFVDKSIMKFCIVASTKELHYILNNQICVAKNLRNIGITYFTNIMLSEMQTNFYYYLILITSLKKTSLTVCVIVIANIYFETSFLLVCKKMIFERSQFKKVGLAFPKLNPLLPFFCGVLRESCFKAPKFHGRIFLLLKYSYLLILYKKHQAIMLSENRRHTLSVSFACKKQPPEVFCKKLCS